MATMKRTAKADFRIGNDGMKVGGILRPRADFVKAGEIVEIETKTRHKSLVAAGVVEDSDEDDAAVPKLVRRTTQVEVEAAEAAATEARNASVAARTFADELRARADAGDADKARAVEEASAAAAAADSAQKHADDLKARLTV